MVFFISNISFLDVDSLTARSLSIDILQGMVLEGLVS